MSCFIFEFIIHLYKVLNNHTKLNLDLIKKQKLKTKTKNNNQETCIHKFKINLIRTYWPMQCSVLIDLLTLLWPQNEVKVTKTGRKSSSSIGTHHIWYFKLTVLLTMPDKMQNLKF